MFVGLATLTSNISSVFSAAKVAQEMLMSVCQSVSLSDCQSVSPSVTESFLSL